MTERPKVARLADWQIGPTVALHPQSEVIQWILDGEWYNWDYDHRHDITTDVEASDVIWLTPTRLGVLLTYACLIDGAKSRARVFIALYDNRIITADLFRVQTYQEWFAEFCRNIPESGLITIV